jgi:O-acetyl-ADP-ribose deacetylase (regulator of RNase III)
VAEAARVSVATVLDVAAELRSVRRVRFVLWGAEDLRVFQRTLEALQPGLGDEAHP